MTLTKKQSIYLLANYLLGYLFIYPLVLGLLTSTLHFVGITQMDSICEIGIYILTFGINFYLAKDLLKEAWLNLKANWKKVVLSSLKYYVVLWVVMIVLQLILISITNLSTSENQAVLMQQIAQNPIKLILLTCVFAPFVEEVVFRGAVYQWFSAKNGVWAGILASSILFGLLHVLSSILSGNWADCIYIIVYSSMGFILCLATRKNKTLASSIMVHGLNNLVGVMLMLI